MTRAPIARWHCPLKRILWATQSSLHSKKSLSCALALEVHCNVKGCGYVPCGRILSAGVNLGVGVRSPRPQSPHAMYRQKSIAASFGLPPSQYEVNLRPDSRRVNMCFEVQRPEVILAAPVPLNLETCINAIFFEILN